VSTDRGAGDNYVYANARTFAYPQHERVYFIGTFHEDFHVKDDFTDPMLSWTGKREVFYFPVPGGDANQLKEDASGNVILDSDGNPVFKEESEVNPNGVRGVSEDKRWGDQMFYAFGRSFNWSAGKQMGAGGAFGAFNYGNGYTENLITESGGTVVGDSTEVSEAIKKYRNHKDNWNFTDTWTPSSPGGVAGALGIANKALGFVASHVNYAVDAATGVISTVVASVTESIDKESPTFKPAWEFWGSRADPEGIKGATHLHPGITTAEKTFGHTYSYHMGLAVGIHEGNTMTRTYGDTEDVVEGDSESVVRGDSYSTIYGATSSVFLGTKSELTMGIDSEIKLALDSTILVGGSFEMTLVAKSEIDIASKLKTKTAPEIKSNPTADIATLASVIQNTMAKVEKVTAEIKKCDAKIDKNSIVLANGIADLQTYQLSVK